ncbi:MAG: ABC transporter ATP-binding protein [Acidimicrobiia bacterium]
MDPSPPVVECRGITKRFGAVLAVDAVDLDVRSGELLALLGPSGCGKTTTLRLVAGFERPDAGSIVLDGTVVAGERFVAPERRRVGVVFQDYALFPHLSVARNVGYGLRDRSSRDRRVAEMLDLVGLTEMADREPHELSGGQQQRVALARALAPDPSLVLLDEPFSNLDAAMRSQVRDDVRRILVDAGATAVVVTHDQEEALSIADRIAVMRDGRIVQVDTPAGVYAHPEDRFIASFVGNADIVQGEVDGATVSTAFGVLALVRPVPPGAVEVVVRPERVRLRLDGGGHAQVVGITFYGHDQVVAVELGDGARVHARMTAGPAFERGDRVDVSVAGPVLAFPSGPRRRSVT